MFTLPYKDWGDHSRSRHRGGVESGRVETMTTGADNRCCADTRIFFDYSRKHSKTVKDKTLISVSS